MEKWIVSPNDYNIVIDGNNYGFIAETVFDVDAKLIASAPELLEACKIALKDTQMLLDGEAEPCEDNYLSTISILQEAIRKAKGV